jgi:hypothetical protein
MGVCVCVCPSHLADQQPQRRRRHQHGHLQRTAHTHRHTTTHTQTHTYIHIHTHAHTSAVATIPYQHHHHHHPNSPPNTSHTHTPLPAHRILGPGGCPLPRRLGVHSRAVAWLLLHIRAHIGRGLGRHGPGPDAGLGRHPAPEFLKIIPWPLEPGVSVRHHDSRGMMEGRRWSRCRHPLAHLQYNTPPAAA